MSISHVHTPHVHDASCSHGHDETAPVETEAGVQRDGFSPALLLGKPLWCFLAGFLLIPLVRLPLIQWALTGGYPLETILGNMLSAIAVGLVIGFIEGRVRAKHQEQQKIMGLPLDPFIERFRLYMTVGALAALAISALMELGLFLAQTGNLTASSTILWSVGAVLLAIVTGFMMLWFSFSWSRWCFGEIRWN